MKRKLKCSVMSLLVTGSSPCQSSVLVLSFVHLKEMLWILFKQGQREGSKQGSEK